MGQIHSTSDRCPNCGNPLRNIDKYCSLCGQENHSLRVPFKHLILEMMEGLLHLDSKSLRTVMFLAFKPGFLTKEFIAGRRATYVPPVRLYVFISFLFFLLFSILPGKHSAGSDSNQINLSFYSVNSDELKGLSPAQLDSLMTARGIEQTSLNRYIAGQIGRIAAGGRAEFNHLLLRGISYMMFLLMPLFALMLLLFYRSRAQYYVDCLIFSLHFHSFVFLLFIVYLLLNVIVSSFVLAAAVALVIALYLFSALNTVYGQRKLALAMKTAAIGVLHMFSIALCILALVFFSIVIF